MHHQHRFQSSSSVSKLIYSAGHTRTYSRGLSNDDYYLSHVKPRYDDDDDDVHTVKNNRNHRSEENAFCFNLPHNRDVHTCWPALETAPSETDTQANKQTNKHLLINYCKRLKALIVKIDVKIVKTELNM